jgi:hypothetical protein
LFQQPELQSQLLLELLFQLATELLSVASASLSEPHQKVLQQLQLLLKLKFYRFRSIII